MPDRWFDAHLDLACLAVNGRDMTRDLATCGGPWPPASITFPSLAEGQVRAFMGTIFTEADGEDAAGYPASDVEAAHRAGVAQLETYVRWEQQGLLTLERAARGGPGPSSASRPGSTPQCLILMECADPIREPGELPWWVERGLRAVGLAWGRGSRYATGNMPPSSTSGAGLSSMGRALVREMDRLGVVHDASHLSRAAFDELASLTSRPIIASHSNSQAILAADLAPANAADLPYATNHRHLTDAQIKEIVRRGGIIGLNLVPSFCRAGLAENESPTIEDAVRHVERVCAIAGDRIHVGLGSDLDGGFSAARLPGGIKAPRDFTMLAEALAARGWTDAQVEGFAWSNWARFWNLAGR